MESPTLLISSGGKTYDATQLLQTVTWAGAYNQCARTLDFDLAVSAENKRLPTVATELGSNVQLFLGGKMLFDGIAFRRSFDGKNTKSLSCADRGFYLKRNEASYKFKNTTPEAIASTVCADFGIQVGNLAATGVSISRNLPGASLYQIIQTAYALAAVKTGKKYMVRFRGAALDVITKEPDGSTLVLRPGSNLLGISVTESVESMVNRVAITDKNDNVVAVRNNSEAISLYGLMQSVLKQQEGENSDTKAQKLLDDNGLEQKITVTNLGNPALISGNCAVLREPVTGLYGLFWIDGDTHTWKNGIYQNKLTLNYRNMMDETEAGSLPSA